MIPRKQKLFINDSYIATYKKQHSPHANHLKQQEEYP